MIVNFQHLNGGKMATLDALQKQAAELSAQLQELARPEAEPLPTTDLEAETSAALQRLARTTARQRVSTALTAELSTVQGEIKRLEAEERKRQADALAVELDAGKSALGDLLQQACTLAGELHVKDNRRYGLLGIPHPSSYSQTKQAIFHLAHAHLNRELKR